MSRKLSDITLYYPETGEEARQFTLKQNLISELYVQSLNAYKPPGISRISVNLSKNDQVYNLKNSSVLRVDIRFDTAGFWKHSPVEQQQVILETIHRVAMLCVETLGWDQVPFEHAYQEVLRRNFVYEIEGKATTSPDRQYKAAIRISKNEEWSELSVVFYNKQGDQIKTVELVKTLSSALFYGEIVKNTRWFNTREFGVHAYNEELILKASLDSEDSIVVFSPSEYDREFLEGYLQQISYTANAEERAKNRAKWANR
jgi:hypothetical protein